MLDRRSAILGTLATSLAGSARARPSRCSDPSETIALWPLGAPGAPATLPVEAIEERSKIATLTDRAMTGIGRPHLVVFRPQRPNGSALLVAPGGGYARVVIDKEGYEIGDRLSAHGFTVFVLFYRLPGEGWAARADVALADAQRAMRMIRSRAPGYGVVPERVGMMGFSAGGHVCGDLATRFDARVYAPLDAADQLSARPAIAAPIYAVQSMRPPLAHARSRALLLGPAPDAALETAHSTADHVSSRTPPCFLVHAEDDTVVPVANTLLFRAACKAATVPVETHLFASGGHGFGLRGAVRTPAEAWPDLFLTWARTHDFG